MRSAFVPFRLSLFGGGADFPSFYRENPYQGLGVSLKQGALITFNDRCFHPENYRLVYSQIETAFKLEEILHPLVRQIFTHCKIAEGELHYTSDFPSRSGLGTSSAFAIGLFMSLLGRAKLENMHCPEMGMFSGKVNSISDKLASLAIHAERLSLAEAGGIQDQILCSRPGITEIRYGNDGWSTKGINCPSTAQFIQDHCVLVELPAGARQKLNRSSANIQTLNLSDERALHDYWEVVKKQSEVGIDAVYRKDLYQFAASINEISSKKNLLSGNTCTAPFSELQEKMREFGALGARVVGAGGGGFALVIGEVDIKRKLLESGYGKRVFSVEISKCGPQFFDKDTI